MLSFIFLLVGVLAQQTFAEEPEAIVGGTAAALGEFPHQCSLRYFGSHICGCSIIGHDKILTAAHCVESGSVTGLKVATGTNSVSGGQLHVVAKIVKHPQYSDKVEDAWKNDIAVITLKSPIQYNQYQSPIALTSTQPAAGQQCILSGWGRISTNGPLSRTLLKMNQTVISQTQCQRSYYDMPLTSTHVCAHNRYGIGVCNGDSGGPLISNGVQIGITSWSGGCAEGMPDVYTNVYHHLNFVKQA